MRKGRERNKEDGGSGTSSIRSKTYPVGRDQLETMVEYRSRSATPAAGSQRRTEMRKLYELMHILGEDIAEAADRPNTTRLPPNYTHMLVDNVTALRRRLLEVGEIEVDGEKGSLLGHLRNILRMMDDGNLNYPPQSLSRAQHEADWEKQRENWVTSYTPEFDAALVNVNEGILGLDTSLDDLLNKISTAKSTNHIFGRLREELRHHRQRSDEVMRVMETIRRDPEKVEEAAENLLNPLRFHQQSSLGLIDVIDNYLELKELDGSIRRKLIEKKQHLKASLPAVAQAVKISKKMQDISSFPEGKEIIFALESITNNILNAQRQKEDKGRKDKLQQVQLEENADIMTELDCQIAETNKETEEIDEEVRQLRNERTDRERETQDLKREMQEMQKEKLRLDKALEELKVDSCKLQRVKEEYQKEKEKNETLIQEQEDRRNRIEKARNKTKEATDRLNQLRQTAQEEKKQRLKEKTTREEERRRQKAQKEQEKKELEREADRIDNEWEDRMKELAQIKDQVTDVTNQLDKGDKDLQELQAEFDEKRQADKRDERENACIETILRDAKDAWLAEQKYKELMATVREKEARGEIVFGELALAYDERKKEEGVAQASPFDTPPKCKCKNAAEAQKLLEKMAEETDKRAGRSVLRQMKDMVERQRGRVAQVRVRATPLRSTICERQDIQGQDALSAELQLAADTLDGLQRRVGEESGVKEQMQEVQSHLLLAIHGFSQLKTNTPHSH